MEKNRVTKTEKEEFKKTIYGKKCYDKFVLLVILLLISCLVVGFLTGYNESGKALLEHQNIVLLIAIVVAIISSEQLGKCEGALNQYVITKKNNKVRDKEETKENKKKNEKQIVKETSDERVVKIVSKNNKKINDKKESSKKSFTKKNGTKSKSSNKVKNEE